VVADPCFCWHTPVHTLRSCATPLTPCCTVPSTLIRIHRNPFPSTETPPPPQTYGRELSEAYEWIQKFKVSRKEAELHQAWDLYYHVFKRINKQLHSLTTLELQYVAPALVSGCCPMSWLYLVAVAAPSGVAQCESLDHKGSLEVSSASTSSCTAYTHSSCSTWRQHW
jgi:hypothetical protein